jgi:3,5-epimerase/4-reductase
MNKYEDNRGRLLFPFKDESILGNVTQSTVSQNNKNVFRGFHCNNFDKLVTCINGRVLDIIVNLDEESDMYLKPEYYLLDPNTDQFQILVPKNYAHGFLSLEENSIVLYHFNGTFESGETKFINYQDPYLNVKLPTNDLILSKNDSKHIFLKNIDYVMIGHKGYIGSKIYESLVTQNKNVIVLKERLEDIVGIRKKLQLYSPKYVINAAGLTGYPNVSWCEDHKPETIETNVVFQLTLVKICNDLGIHLTIVGSGGIFKGKDVRFDTDQGDYFDTFYSECRIYLENMIRNYDNILYLRVNYPLSSDDNPKNLLVKLSKWDKICDSEMSITCLDSLVPLLSSIVENKEVGVLNFVNPGTINLIDIKKMYNKAHNIDNDFSVTENKDRPCPILDTKKIQKYDPECIQYAILTALNIDISS